MPFFVKMRVVETLPKPVSFGWDDRECALAFHCGDDGVGIIGFVCNNMFSRQVLDEFKGWHAVMDLATG